MKKLIKNEDGQTMIIFVFVLVALIGFAALVVDLGMDHVTKGTMQKAADSAALAASQDLDISANTAINTAITYAQKNGLKSTVNGVTESGDTITVTTPYNGDATKIEVTCKRKVNYSLAGVLGLSSANISAHAVAQRTGVTSPAFNYTLFSGQVDLEINGNKHIIDGDVYGKTGVNIYGNQSEINGTAVSGNNICNVPPGTTVVKNTVIDFPDLTGLIRSQATVYTQAQINALISSGQAINGPIYVDGDLTINGRIRGTGIIYASGNIIISPYQQPTDSIIFCTGNDFTFNGGSGLIYGVLYAPNGGFTNNGGPNGEIYGRILTKDAIVDNGAKFSLHSSTNDINGLSTLITTKLVE
ncbi:MAG: pilus assembly protein TadG-related protein [Bacillota bacterium]|nr:pilus assembly protein TadG-related protein [Bacillota bacterium]